MCDLSANDILLIDRLSNAKTPKVTIAEVVHCSVSTVFNKLNDLHPRDGSSGQIKLRSRRKGNYKGDDQLLYEIKKYVLCHRFCTRLDIIGYLNKIGIQVKSESSITNWLKQLGIGTYVAVTKQFLSAQNKVDRYGLQKVL